MTIIAIANIIQTAGTQLRVKTNEDNIIDMMDLISRGVAFKEPMRLADWNEGYYLIDGFHRIAAYERLGIGEIPMEMFVVVPANSIEEVRVLAAGANVQHGKGNTRGDYANIIKKMMAFGDVYMKDVFTPDCEKIALAIGAPIPAVKRGYNNHVDEESGVTLQQVCKEKRNAAIIGFHKDGKSDREIARLCQMDHKTVGRAIADYVGQISPKEECPTSHSILAQASTAQRDGAITPTEAWLTQFAEDDGMDVGGITSYSLAEDETDLNDCPFDVLAATGFKDDNHRNNKSNAANDSVCLESESIGRQGRIAFLRTKIAEYSEELAALLAEEQQAA